MQEKKKAPEILNVEAPKMQYGNFVNLFAI